MLHIQNNPKVDYISELRVTECAKLAKQTVKSISY